MTSSKIGRGRTETAAPKGSKHTREYFSELSQGWKSLLLCTMGVAMSAAVMPIYSFSALSNSLVDEFGWSRAEVQGAATAFFVVLVFSGPLSGWVIKRVPIAKFVVISILLFAANMALLGAQNGSIKLFYVSYAVLTLSGLGTLLVTWSLLVNFQFEKARGLALAILLSGTGLAGMLLPTYTTWLIASFGWRLAYCGIAALPLLLMLPAIYLMRSEIKDVFGRKEVEGGEASVPALPGLSLRQAFGHHRFWILVAVMASFVFMHVGFLFNLIPLLTDRGIGAFEAASMAGTFGVALTVGRLGAGYLIDHFWAPAVAFVAMTLPALACYIFLRETSSTPLLIMAIALIGMSGGVEMDVASFLVVKYFGLVNYPQIYALLMSSTAIGGSLGPLMFGLVFDTTGSYDAIVVVAMGVFGLMPALLLTLGKYPAFLPADISAKNRFGKNETAC